MRKYFYAALFILLMAPVQAQTKQNGKQPFVLGVVDSIHSVVLNETRTLNIYLPEGYSSDSATLYPVIYLLDGSADEDFIHVAGLVQFCNFSWVDILPKSIVVGIANVDRRRDFTFPTTIKQDKKDYPSSGASAGFIAFIEKELQPYIQNNYHACAGKMLVGQSLGGLLATQILFTKPDLFSQYVIVSPSLWWDNESMLKRKMLLPQSKKHVYIAVGNEGKVMVGDAKNLFRLLSKQPAFSTSFRYFGNEDHATIFHEALYRAFQSFAKKRNREKNNAYFLNISSKAVAPISVPNGIPARSTR